jgi:hypothetical protein
MKFGFKLGKKEKEIPLEAALDEEAAPEEGEDLLPVIPQDVEPVGPHAPLLELSLDAEIPADGTDDLPLEDPAGAKDENGEPIKLVEFKAESAPAAPPAPVPATPPVEAKKEPEKKPGGGLDLNTSIGNIFTDAEEEENPLTNLIKSLPEVAATELLDDLKEINDIIKDWQKK